MITLPSDHPDHPTHIIARRLAARHGLTPDEAEAAVDQARRGETGPHTHLVTAEMAAIVHDIAEAAAPVMRAFRDALAALQPTLARIAASRPETFVLHHAVHQSEPTRPAWQSPYGPQRNRHG